jgi:hypothetical protein
VFVALEDDLGCRSLRLLPHPINVGHVELVYTGVHKGLLLSLKAALAAISAAASTSGKQAHAFSLMQL